MLKVDLFHPTKKREQEIDKTITDINSFYLKYCKELDFDPQKKRESLSEEELKYGKEYFSKKTEALRKEIEVYKMLYSEEEALLRVLPKAYGLVKAASAFLWNKPHYDVQLKGGILLNKGYAAEMATGEGKTLTATLPIYLNALLKKGAHVLTPNGYLAKRDFEEMKVLYEILGLSCALVEEQEPLKEEEIYKKTLEVLKTDLDKYTQFAKTEAEKEEKIKEFFAKRENKSQIREARTKAIELLTIEERIKRQQAYSADITYGASSTFAFDYLRDDLELDVKKTVQRPGRPNFAVIDEVDAVLFDDATTPFTLSGKQTDEELAINEEEKKEKRKKIEKANLAIARINIESGKLFERYGNNQALIATVSNDDEKYEAITRNETESANFQDMTRAIVINTNNQEYTITTLGQIMLFEYYCDKDINKILKENLDKIVSLRHDDEPMYREGYDYTINEYGRIQMEPRAFAHLVMSGFVPELSTRFDEFGQNEFVIYGPEIDNAIRAWFILEQDVDYKLSKATDPKVEGEEVVSLVINGRTAEGRVYSNGLQQAIEAKIRYKTGKPIRETEIKNTLASIPTASFFARYQKFGGMTGTSAEIAFENLYNLETERVERQRPKRVVDHGERMYASTEEKNEAIFLEVLKSYQKGQPVLLSTTSIEESILLQNFLKMRFTEVGLNIEIPVLNANVNLAEEAKIISKAGLPKAITIATEMAGRGTDIKLGGELPEVSDLIPVIIAEKTEEIIKDLQTKKEMSKEEIESIRKKVSNQLIEQKHRVEPFAIARRNLLAKEREKVKKELEDAGGLKVIGSGHFAYSRVDNQVKGRCGRQGEKGEVIFFNDSQDLLNVGVPQKIVERLQKQAEQGPIIEEPNKGYYPISNVVLEAQHKTEVLTESSIKASQEIEVEVSKYRRNLRKQKDLLKQRGSYIDTIEYMIEETSKSIILAASRRENPHLTDKTRLTIANLDYEELISLSEEFIGVRLTKEEIEKCKTLGDLRKVISSYGLSSFREKIASDKDFSQECQSKVEKMFPRVWNRFEEMVETVKYQDYLNKLMQFQGGMELPAQIAIAYKHAIESERACLVRSIINPEYLQTLNKEPRMELISRRSTPNGIQIVTKEIDKEPEKKEETSDFKNNISNLQPFPRMFTLVNKVALNRNSSEVGTKTDRTFDEVESVDFSDGAFSTKK